MTAKVGRKVIVYRDNGASSPAEKIAAGRTKTLTFNATPIDITSDDDDGVRQLLEEDAGEKSLDMSFEGLSIDKAFIKDLTNGNHVDDYKIEIEGLIRITGTFFCGSVAIGAPYNEAATLSCEFQSSGAWTVTDL